MERELQLLCWRTLFYVLHDILLALGRSGTDVERELIATRSRLVLEADEI